MKRIQMNSSGLLVSKAGYDVTSATPGELSLNTGANKLFSIFLQGSIALADFTVTYNGTSGSVHNIQSNAVIEFGQTFAAPPICLLTQEDPILSSGTTICVNQAYSNVDVQETYGAGTFNTGSGGGSYLWYEISDTALTIYWNWTSITYAPPTPTYVNYSILRTS